MNPNFNKPQVVSVIAVFLVFLAGLFLLFYDHFCHPTFSILPIDYSEFREGSQKDLLDLLDKFFQSGQILLAALLGYIFIETKEKSIYTSYKYYIPIILTLGIFSFFFYSYEDFVSNVIQIKKDLLINLPKEKMLDLLGSDRVNWDFKTIRYTFYLCVIGTLFSINLMYSREQP